MNKKIDKRALDELGRNLVRNGNVGLPAETIDKIVSNPVLFARISKDIAQGSPADGSSRFALRNVLAFSGTAAFLLAVVAIVTQFTVKDGSLAAAEAPAPEAAPEISRPALPPQGTVKMTAAGRVHDRVAERAAAPKKVTTRAQRKGERVPRVNEPEGDFYALPGNSLADSNDGGRIIRANVPRSSLFALGVNIPLENGPEMVKADLLVGSDGVTRAVRVVK